VDNFSRVSPAIKIDFSLKGKRVVEVMERLKMTFGLPKIIKVDNGSEFISKAMDEWAHHNGVKLAFSRPGQPTDNAFSESFNGRLRQECLNQNWITTLADARQMVEAWREDYNELRPHSSLDYRTPSEYVIRWQ
jgi:putative transposase